MSPGISTRLVQLLHPDEGRRAALVYESKLHLLASYRSLYSFALAALDTGWKLRDLLSTDLSGIELDYDAVYALTTPWRFLPCFDQPDEPGRCLLSAAGPPWRYIGSGAGLRGHGDELPSASPDLAAAYVIGHDGAPRRIGVTTGVTSGGTLGQPARFGSIGPELILDAALPQLEGVVTILRGGRQIATWSVSNRSVPLPIALASIEPDHFESADFRRPGDTHIHFFGERLFNAHLGGAAPATAPAEDDEVVVEFQGLGRPLRNPIRAQHSAARVAAVQL
jgi:hypothetical protein